MTGILQKIKEADSVVLVEILAKVSSVSIYESIRNLGVDFRTITSFDRIMFIEEIKSEILSRLK